ncbi:hypothetical protein [Tabrizicola flagellatus]|uniref:hypothetical protein n=1 Tax=Tabrizicola flagellatus TaxID=2593021 RepID=UPI0011F34AB5|nr:hypothetical protein [Tabrizicola flagellatus]
MPNRTPTLPHTLTVATAGRRVACLALLAGLALAPLAQAATPGLAFPHPAPADAKARLQTVSNDVIGVMAQLVGIQGNLLLGHLLRQEGAAGGGAAQFEEAWKTDFPQIREALAQAGAPDLEPLLAALAQGPTDETYIDALTGLKRAKEALAPTEQDLLHALILNAEEALAQLDPSGTTAVPQYQKAWSLLMAARGELDLLVFSRDPAVKQQATKMALAFDDVVMFAPDPAARGPVAFDPALVSNLIATLKGQIQSL